MPAGPSPARGEIWLADLNPVRGHEQSQTALQRLVAPYPNARVVIGTSRPLTEEAILAFVTTDVAVIGRSRAAFPLLGMGDPVKQAVLLLNQSRDENFAELDRALAHNEHFSRAPEPDAI